MSNYPEQYPASFPEQPAGPGPVAPTRRPGTVTAACILTWIFSGLALLASGYFAIGLIVQRDEFVEQMEKDENFQDLDVSAASIADSVSAIGIALAIFCLVAIVLAVFTFAGSSVARTLLVVCAVIAALIALVASLAIIPFLWVIVCVTTIVLLFTGGAGQWFRAKKAS